MTEMHITGAAGRSGGDCLDDQ